MMLSNNRPGGKKYLQARGNTNQNIAIILFNFFVTPKIKNLYNVCISVMILSYSFPNESKFSGGKI